LAEGKIAPAVLLRHEAKEKKNDFTMADQDWIGLMIFKNFANQDWIGFNFIGSGLDRIQFYRIRTGSDSILSDQDWTRTASWFDCLHT